MSTPSEIEPNPARESGSSRWSDLRYVVGLFVASRVLIICVALVGPLFFMPGPYYKGKAWEIGWEEYASRWDTGWYSQIAQLGYKFTAEGKGSVAFFPLFPLLIRGAMGLGFSPVAAAIGIANLCFFASLWLFYRFTREEFESRSVAETATALLAFTPGLAWFSIGYTESLFLALTLGLLIALRSGRYGWATLIGVVAGLSRPNAVVLIVPLGLFLWPRLLEAWRARSWRLVGASIAVGSPVIGHALYLGYLQIAFGNWRANHIAEFKGWDAQIMLTWEVAKQKIPGVGLHLFDNPERFWEYVSWSWFVLLFVSLFSFAVFWRHRARLWLTVFIVCFVGLYGSMLQLGGPLHSVGRYGAQLFPFYLAFALFAEDYRWARSAAIAVCTACATITGLMLFTGYHLN
jgi:Gpi18-like mannosyltransferase